MILYYYYYIKYDCYHRVWHNTFGKRRQPLYYYTRETYRNPKTIVINIVRIGKRYHYNNIIRALAEVID